MNVAPKKLTITVSRTATGEQDYMQIMSDQFSLNIVLIADEIVVRDVRDPVRNSTDARPGTGKRDHSGIDRPKERKKK